jgi:hypothetical protein
MKMRSAFIELLHEDRRTEINKGTKDAFFFFFFPNSTKQPHSQCILYCCSQKDTVPVMFSVLLYSTFTVQTVLSATDLYLQ